MRQASKFTTLFLLLSILSLNAQTIDQSFFPKSGVVTENKIVGLNNVILHPPPEEGVDLVWDYSTVWNISVSNTTSWLEPELGQFWEEMDRPTILKFEGDESSSKETYYSHQGDTLYLVGEAYSFNSLIFSYDVGERIYMIDGFSFGDEFNNSWFTDYIFAGVGTLITPQDTFFNAFLIKEVDFSDVNYRWYHENLNREVAAYLPHGVVIPSNVPGFSWMSDYQDSSLSNTEHKLKVESNLTVLRTGTGFQLINGNDAKFNADISLMAIDGKSIFRQQLDVEPGINEIEIVTKTLPTGIYNILILDRNSGKLNSFKLQF